MIKINLSFKDIILLDKCLDKNNKVKDELKLELLVNDEATIHQLVELVSDKLVAEGFCENWEPNEHGNNLEELIDILNRGLW